MAAQEMNITEQNVRTNALSIVRVECVTRSRGVVVAVASRDFMVNTVLKTALRTVTVVVINRLKGAMDVWKVIMVPRAVQIVPPTVHFRSATGGVAIVRTALPVSMVPRARRDVTISVEMTYATKRLGHAL